jgi:hypothetical protein
MEPLKGGLEPFLTYRADLSTGSGTAIAKLPPKGDLG